MKKHEVKVGGRYSAKVSDKVVVVRIDAENPHGGWDATNEATGKRVRIKSAQRLRGAVKGDAKPAEAAAEGKKTKVDAWRKEVAAKVAQPDPALDQAVAAADKGRQAKAKKTRAPREKRPSLLDLAAEVLAKAKEPMDCKGIVEKVLASGRWSTKGKTPEATLYSAIIREIAAKGKEARFHKTGRGQFELSAAARQ